MSLYTRMLMATRRFIADQRGVFAASFVIMSGFLLGMIALGFEGSRYITEQARLSDAMEQAALALTAEDNGVGAARNDTLARDYFRAYMRHAVGVNPPTVVVSSGRSPTHSNLTYVEYRISGHTLQNSWFSSSLFPSFAPQVAVGSSGAARKYRSNIDVMFVTDFSSSMDDPLAGGGRKIDELKRLVLKLSGELFSFGIDNKIGFVPFSWGTRQGENCDFPFATLKPIPEDLLKTREPESYASFGTYVDINATVAAIPNAIHDNSIPLSNVDDATCLKKAVAWNVPLTSNDAAIKQIGTMVAYGNTLVSSGILVATPMLHAGTASRKVLIIVSDGADYPLADITSRLISAGMCSKIRSALTTKDAVGKIAFVGVGYTPTVKWEQCVGAKNVYLPNTVQALEDDLRRAIFEEVGHNTVKNYPAPR